MVGKITVIFFIFLVSHITLIIPKNEFECDCENRPERMSCCCNCPHCVAKRGGFLSACGCHERTERPLGGIPLIERDKCFCGYHSDFDLPGVKYPILAVENPFSLPVLEIHHFFPVLPTLSSQAYISPPEHPS